MKIDLIKGDCLDIMDKLIGEGVKVDCIITDPPYGTTACKWDSVIPFDDMWERLNKLIKPNGAIVLFGSEPFSSALRMSNVKNYKYDWKWDKVKPSGFQIAKYRPMLRTEDIMVFTRKGKKVIYNPQMIKREIIKKSKVYNSSDSNPLKYNDGKERVYTEKYPQSLLEFSNANQKGKVHPTQKPVDLLEYLIKTYTNEGDLVLDFTMGSGSTGIACLNTNRNFIGIELDNAYFETCKNRANTYINDNNMKDIQLNILE